VVLRQAKVGKVRDSEKKYYMSDSPCFGSGTALT
jgi:hypothetical protein